MSIKLHTPCDDGVCPYDAQYNHDCEWWCGAEEPEDLPEGWDEDGEVFEDDFEDDDFEDEDFEDEDFEESDFDLDMGFDPYMGCYSDDC